MMPVAAGSACMSMPTDDLLALLRAGPALRCRTAPAKQGSVLTVFSAE